MSGSNSLKVALISSASSIHTVRWANGLSEAGHEVHVISQHSVCERFNAEVKLHLFPSRGNAGYFTMVPGVKKLLSTLTPDIVNAHYASGYATTARLVGWHPWLLSVWGSDVYSFPYKSPIHMWLVKKNIMSADMVASTSRCMAEQVRRLTPSIEDIQITPFGVDMAAYSSINAGEARAKTSITVGTVKTMASTYGIDILIRAFSLVLAQLGKDEPALAEGIKLRLVGGGPDMEKYQAYAQRLGLQDKVEFVGRVPHHMVPVELAKLDVYVALSRAESFGVAVIEAGAAGCPVVVSDVGGLPEVTLHNKTGLVVPPENPQLAAEAMRLLILDSQMRSEFGLAAKKHVSENYSWQACVQTMVDVYRKAI